MKTIKFPSQIISDILFIYQNDETEHQTTISAIIPSMTKKIKGYYRDSISDSARHVCKIHDGEDFIVKLHRVYSHNQEQQLFLGLGP